MSTFSSFHFSLEFVCCLKDSVSEPDKSASNLFQLFASDGISLQETIVGQECTYESCLIL